MQITLWDYILNKYSKAESLPPIVVEYIAVFDILKYSVEGISNKRISSRLNMPVDYIENVLIDFLHFTGWDVDIDFSPVALFYLSACNYSVFYYKVISTSLYDVSDNIITLMYNICIRFNKIKETINKYGY